MNSKYMQRPQIAQSRDYPLNEGKETRGVNGMHSMPLASENGGNNVQGHLSNLLDMIVE